MAHAHDHSDAHARAHGATAAEMFVAALRAAKLRVTDVRLAVMACLDASASALAANEVLDRLAASRPRDAKADRVTVYRTLNALVEAGVAHKVDPGDRVFRFSLTDHARCTPTRHVHEHPHLVCDACGSVECLDDADVIVQARGTSAPSRRRIARLSKQSITLHATCERCEAKAPAPSRDLRTP
jgi:Fur family ferric uptake transcriptional regulator